MTRLLQALTVVGTALCLVACQAEKPAEEIVRPVLTKTLAFEAPVLESFAGEVVSKFETTLGFRVFGVVVERSVEAGDLVQAGQQIARVDATTQELAVRSAEAALASAQAQYSNVLAVEQRQRTLFGQNNVSASVYEAAQQALKASTAALEQAQSQLAKANEQLGYTTLRSDKAGLVVAVDVELGQTVGIGQPVVTIVQPEFRKAVISQLESQSGELRVGDRFTVAKQLDPDVVVQGTVVEIAPEADPVTRTVKVDIDLEDPTGLLRLGSTILATRSLDEQSRLVVPATAVFTLDGQTQVWVVDPASMTVGKRATSLQPINESSFEVLEGLVPGDIVVIAGAGSLAEGQPIKAHQEK